MIPPEIFGALRLATARTTEFTRDGVLTDGQPYDGPLPAGVITYAYRDLTDAEITYDGHTAAIQANPGS